jgi:hypothetical protein
MGYQGETRYNSFEVHKKPSHNIYAKDGALVVLIYLNQYKDPIKNSHKVLKWFGIAKSHINLMFTYHIVIYFIIIRYIYIMLDI